MVTLIAAYNLDGCIGRCDARCYNAKGNDCTCICGGRNHGKGLGHAAENTAHLADEMIQEYSQEKPDIRKFTTFAQVEHTPQLTQLPLPLEIPTHDRIESE